MKINTPLWDNWSQAAKRHIFLFDRIREVERQELVDCSRKETPQQNGEKKDQSHLSAQVVSRWNRLFSGPEVYCWLLVLWCSWQFYRAKTVIASIWGVFISFLWIRVGIVGRGSWFERVTKPFDHRAVSDRDQVRQFGCVIGWVVRVIACVLFVRG